MPGLLKRKYETESISIIKQINRELNSIKLILPKVYDGKILFSLYKRYFPNNIQMLIERYNHYKEKDNYLRSIKKKERYKPLNVEDFFFSSAKVKHILSGQQKKNHYQKYNEELRQQSLMVMEKKLNIKIQKQQEKEKKNQYIQNIDPAYLHIFIKIYHKSNHNDKVIILNELKKFNSEKVIQFFYKINDAERNNQLRNMAFYHLQSLGKYVKLRRKFKGNVKEYHIDKSLPEFSPQELLKFLNTDSVESKKTYDAFISHSYLDKEYVHALKRGLNQRNLSCYYDWTSDRDFLKRNLISNYTKEVLKKRIEQSNVFILLFTNNVFVNNKINSEWIKMEIEHATKIGKKIYCINILGHENDFIDIKFEFINDSILVSEKLLD